MKDIKKDKVMNQIAEIKTLMVLAAGKTKLLSLSAEGASPFPERKAVEAVIKKYVPEAQYFLLSKGSRETIDTKVSVMLAKERRGGMKCRELSL